MISRNTKGSVFLIGFLLLLAIFALLYAAPPQGRRLFVTSQMPINAIQKVLDAAKDGDTIVFNKGTYDFSGAPPYEIGTALSTYDGALKIIDKSLILKGQEGVLIQGAPSVLNTTGYGYIGITAIYFQNVGRDKNLTVENIDFNTLMMGVSVYGGNDIDVHDCVCTGIDRNGVGMVGVGGDICLRNNSIASRRMGYFIDWWYAEPNGTHYQSPGTQIQISGNVITSFGGSSEFFDIYINGCGEALIAGNDLSAAVGCGIWIQRMAPTDEPATPRCFISGNDIRGPLASQGRGVYLQSASGVQVDNNTFHEADRGIYLVYSVGCNVYMNTLKNIKRSGVLVYGSYPGNHQVTANNIQVAGPVDQSYNAYGIITYGNFSLYSRNIVTGIGTAAFFVFSDGFSIGHDEIFDCNNAQSFTPPENKAHYAFYVGTYNNRASETWENGVRYVNWGDPSNIVTTQSCL